MRRRASERGKWGRTLVSELELVVEAGHLLPLAYVHPRVAVRLLEIGLEVEAELLRAVLHREALLRRVHLVEELAQPLLPPGTVISLLVVVRVGVPLRPEGILLLHLNLVARGHGDRSLRRRGSVKGTRRPRAHEAASRSLARSSTRSHNGGPESHSR